ncbi:biotin/lipoyl-containing protein [Fusobacterium sp. IOR10]|uniref:biotin/lipoyl-containing protein n=1 Tax=Fusobacterium sp. IOR10 TaxID=2665157 RepID=UPI0013D1137B|nr:biotin/lipoyl-containing protein [Fusobacterium sp. IOR10]
MKKVYKIKVNEKVYEIELEEVKTVDGHVEVSAPKAAAPVQAPQPVIQQAAPVAASTGAAIEAPMPGVVVDMKVKVGDAIAEGDLVAIIEAMKMETELYADKSGTVSAVNVAKGSQINAGDVLVVL